VVPIVGYTANNAVRLKSNDLGTLGDLETCKVPRLVARGLVAS
jgi:hypothetical protein